ncbi:DUF4335 domain-containing protein [Kovacikia minuta CCNUW1]|uniref:DUF4335 domain-containing protein n=1 Tax=Kovacikia minuta TaxID=2931930 RepID=UPI001CCC78BB|nr:DUF4335 domain-containing protein [Kovacikia minuta]UBF25835.1 DUF4335 domain-containing protein [Kovacikia minuta CCNUW1]
MTIQRQYSLPNCTLMLEGLGDLSVAGQPELRPLMNVLINAECQLPGQEKPLSGGREFFESLVNAVSLYAQEVISGIYDLRQPKENSSLVQLHRLDVNRHRLSILPEGAVPGSGIAAQLTRHIDLTTVQLFDLVEAVDQFFADNQTLPDLTLNLKSQPKRHYRSSEPAAQRTIPIALGASSLAVASIALFFLPVPKVSEPTCLSSSTPGCTSNKNATSSPTPTLFPSPAGNSPSPSPSPTSASSPSPSPAASGQPDLAKLEAALVSSPEITDAAEIDTLQKKLYSQINDAWKDRSPVTQDLVYRVGVGKDGAIIGYKPVNPAAVTNAKQTPLLDLLSIPSSSNSRPASDPLAQYKVVFTSSGVLEVAPWNQVMASPLNAPPEITDAGQLKDLQQKLYDQLDQNWKEPPTFEQDLVFRVRMKSDGSIFDYKPDSQTATDYAKETPLPTLGKPAVDGDSASGESLALFKAVFKPNGVLEVSPWRGRKD